MRPASLHVMLRMSGFLASAMLLQCKDVCEDGMLKTMLTGVAGEVLVGPKRLYLLDEPTTGLDSSTAYRLVSSIREFVHKDKVRALLPKACPPREGAHQVW